MTDLAMAPEQTLRREGGRVLAPPMDLLISCTSSHRTATSNDTSNRNEALTALWRGWSAERFDVATAGRLDLVLTKTAVLRTPEWLAASRGDATAAIGIVFGLLPIVRIDRRVDLAMSALCFCALEGNSAAAKVLADVLRRLPGDDSDTSGRHSQLAASWCPGEPMPTGKSSNIQCAPGAFRRDDDHDGPTNARGSNLLAIAGAEVRHRRSVSRIQIFSDLHVGLGRQKLITIDNDVDVIVVAGDTCEGVLRAFEHLRRIVPMHIPVVMVLGNHEYYRGFVSDELALARAIAPSLNIHVLENDTVAIGGVRFVGATLWTDYLAFGAANQPAIMNACAAGMNDHRLIGWQKQPWLRFRPQEAARLHHESRRYFADTLAVPFAGPTVVVVHHAVHWNSVALRYVSDPITGAYVSDLSASLLTAQPDLVVHGHVHNSSDYHVGRTRVICNPHGYGDENLAFNGALVVEVRR